MFKNSMFLFLLAAAALIGMLLWIGWTYAGGQGLLPLSVGRRARPIQNGDVVKWQGGSVSNREGKRKLLGYVGDAQAHLEVLANGQLQATFPDQHARAEGHLETVVLVWADLHSASVRMVTSGP